MKTILIMAALVVATAGQLRAGIIGPSESGFTQIYGLDLNIAGNLQSNVPYSLDIANTITGGSFTRVAYHMELQVRGTNELNYVWVSMDAFTANASLLGVPSFAGSNAIFQQNVANMNVFSNQAGIVTGNGLGTGNIEFWAQDYVTTNAAGVPNASGTIYDTGDQRFNGGSYGSMQIHNHASNANQTLFALNRFGAGANGFDLGIGNSSATNTDWTFAGNSAGYDIKTVDVWVNGQVIPEPASLTIFGTICLVACVRRRKS